LKVRTTKKADEYIRAIETWWRANRLSAPALFADELATAFETLSLFPNAGSPYRGRARSGVRRLLLRATRHHVYYLVNDAGVLVVAVWGAVRGSAPNLRELI
jgi:plasmid stabilization system protein ParE